MAVGGQLLATRPVHAAKSYGAGLTDSEIKIANTGPYRGWYRAPAPDKTVEMTRKLVESDAVLFLLGSLGTPTNTAIWRYTNENKVQERSATIEASLQSSESQNELSLDVAMLKADTMRLIPFVII